MSEATLEAVPRRAGSDSQRGALPLLVGVTGHRDLREEDVGRLEGEVGRVLDAIEKQMPKTSIIIVSALAEGADRLVARVGLKRGCRLVAPLPMPPEIYEEDFEDQKSREEFRELLGRAEPSFALSEGRIADPAADREGCYELVATHLAQNCQVLIALWDGESTGKRGGTSKVVEYALEGVPGDMDARLNGRETSARVGPLDEPDGCAIVHHVFTPRRSAKPAPPRRLPPARWIYPKSALGEKQVAKRFERIAANLAEFNADARALGRRALVGPNRGAGLLSAEEEEALPPNLRALRDQYALADALAKHFQRRTRLARDFLLAIMFFAITAFSLYSNIPLFQTPWTVAVYFVAILLAYVAWLLFVGRGADESDDLYIARLLCFVLPRWSRGDNQRKFLDYRALAEAQRVQFYWSLVALDDRAEDHYLRQHRTELDWIRVALRVQRLLRDDFQIPAPTNRRARLNQAFEYWVKGQKSYFEDSVGNGQKQITRSKRIVRVLLLAGLLLTLTLVFARWRELEWNLGILGLLAGLLPAAAGLIQYRIERRGVSEQKKRYDRMRVLYSIANERLADMLESELDERGEARELLRELGLEALFENADWVLLHRDRPVSMPSP